MNRVYRSDYADSSSSAFIELAAEIESEMFSLLLNSNETSNSTINGVKVTALRNGSVLADMIIASNTKNLSASLVESAVNKGIADGNLTSLGATGTVEVQGM